MNRRQRLGQHFLTSNKIAELIVNSAHITQKDTILEVGTGRGILTKLLCKNAKNVISVESDKTLYHNAKSAINADNLELRYGDGLDTLEHFTVFVSNLPYSESKNTVEWLAQRHFSHAVIMVQKEFAQKISPENKQKAVSVIANYSFGIKKILNVGKNNFDPPPKVDSVVLYLTRKKSLSAQIIKTVNRLFSYRRKTLQNILKQFDEKSNDQRRLDELSGDEIIKIAKQLK